jgi:hypothetical protein
MKMLSAFVAAAGLAAVLAAPSFAQDQPGEPVRLRGTIEAVDGNTLNITTREGEQVAVQMADDAAVLTTAALSLDAIKDNSYVGIAGIAGEGDQISALEVFVMPEANRGAGEGHRPWDLEPQSTMTNGNVDAVAESGEGVTLTVSYKDGQQTIVVTPETPIVTFNPGTRDDLQPGLYVYVAGRKLPDGTYTTASVRVEKDGVKPPM